MTPQQQADLAQHLTQFLMRPVNENRPREEVKIVDAETGEVLWVLCAEKLEWRLKKQMEAWFGKESDV